MTGPPRAKRSSLALAVIAACGAAFALACGPDYYEIPIETPIQPKMDVSPFQRVLVVGFVAGGSEDVDANQETVRLLRSQLRTKSSLKVIDADILPLIEIAKEQSQGAPGNAPDDTTSGAAPAGRANGNAANQTLALPQNIKEEKDLEPYERLFANTAYWKRIGEEFQNPLIVTGTVLFSSRSTSGFVQRDQETTTASAAASSAPCASTWSARASSSARSSCSSTAAPARRCTRRATAKRFSTTRSRTRRRCRRISS